MKRFVAKSNCQHSISKTTCFKRIRQWNVRKNCFFFFCYNWTKTFFSIWTKKNCIFRSTSSSSSSTDDDAFIPTAENTKNAQKTEEKAENNVKLTDNPAQINEILDIVQRTRKRRGSRPITPKGKTFFVFRSNGAKIEFFAFFLFFCVGSPRTWSRYLIHREASAGQLSWDQVTKNKKF